MFRVGQPVINISKDIPRGELDSRKQAVLHLDKIDRRAFMQGGVAMTVVAENNTLVI